MSSSSSSIDTDDEDDGYSGVIVKVKRLNKPKKDPAVSIKKDRFYFNSSMYKLAGLHNKNFVIYSINPEKKQIYFEFLEASSDPDAFILGNKDDKYYYKRSPASLLISTYPWIKSAVGKEAFIAKQHKEHSNVWVIVIA